MAWTGATLANRRKALIAARSIIDALNYKGVKHSVYTLCGPTPETSGVSQDDIQAAEASQPLEFPRGTDTEVPEAIRIAEYEIAYALLDGKDPELELENLAISAMGYGAVKTNYERSQLPIEHIINHGAEFCRVALAEAFLARLGRLEVVTIELGACPGSLSTGVIAGSDAAETELGGRVCSSFPGSGKGTFACSTLCICPVRGPLVSRVRMKPAKAAAEQGRCRQGCRGARRLPPARRSPRTDLNRVLAEDRRKHQVQIKEQAEKLEGVLKSSQLTEQDRKVLQENLVASRASCVRLRRLPPRKSRNWNRSSRRSSWRARRRPRFGKGCTASPPSSGRCKTPL